MIQIAIAPGNDSRYITTALGAATPAVSSAPVSLFFTGAHHLSLPAKFKIRRCLRAQTSSPRQRHLSGVTAGSGLYTPRIKTAFFLATLVRVAGIVPSVADGPHPQHPF
jgi:hypothetical protein